DDIRRRNASIALSTDIICGFCTESEEEYQDTYRVIEEVGYHLAFIFKYSERKHTIASRKYPDDVPETAKVDRVNRLIERQKQISLHKNEEMVGHTVHVLVESNSKKSTEQWMGKSDSNVTVVWQKGEAPTKPGDLVSVVISRASVTTLFGSD